MRWLKNKRGDGYVVPCVMIVVICMMLSVFIFFAGVVNMVHITQENTKVVLDSYVMKSSIEIYNSIKQGSDYMDVLDQNVYIDAYQSFAAGEVDARTAHEIGMKLAEELWGAKFHVVVATHLNTGHFHNHFAICSTSFIDGSRYHDDKHSKYLMRQASDRLCQEYGLSVIENHKYQRKKNYAEWYADKNGMPTLLSQMKSDVDAAILQSMSERQFILNMEQMGYTVTLRGRSEEPLLSVTPRGYKHPWRLSNHFGEEYTYKRIMERVEGHRRQPLLPEEKTKPVHLRSGAENFMKVTTLHALYIHTLYQFGFIPKNSNKKIPVDLREDIIKLNSIIAETRLLGRNHIDTDEQLFAYRKKAEGQIGTLSEQRQKLRNRLRRCSDEDEMSSVKEKLSSLSSEIGKLRREVKLCDNIAVRSGVLQEKLTQIYIRENYERKDDRTNEQFRRRS